MTGLLERHKWKAALIGALISSLVGPGVPLLVMACVAVRHSSSIREAASIIFNLPVWWICPLIPVGPPAFVLGGAGGVLLQNLAARSRSMKIVITQAAVLGLVLGSLVPFCSAALGWGPTYNFKENVIGGLPVSAATGVVCALVVLWLLRRWRLLQLRGNAQVAV
jgi:hypothetical protein